jgi:hypothetical protein
MTRDEIIKMVREIADPTIADPIGGEDETVLLQMHELERLAARLAAAEREACATVAEQFGWSGKWHVAAAIRARGDKP